MGEESDAGETLALDFVNSASCPSCRVGDALANPKEMKLWLAAHPRFRGEVVRERSMPELRRLRTTLRDLFDAQVRGTRPPGPSLASFNRAIARHEVPAILQWREGRWELTGNERTPRGPEALEGVLVRAARDLLTGASASKIRQCRGPGCAHFLLARTRNQIWCSATGCGNRARVARHYQRARHARGSGASRGRGRAPRSAAPPRAPPV